MATRATQKATNQLPDHSPATSPAASTVPVTTAHRRTQILSRAAFARAASIPGGSHGSGAVGNAAQAGLLFHTGHPWPALSGSSGDHAEPSQYLSPAWPPGSCTVHIGLICVEASAPPTRQAAARNRLGLQLDDHRLFVTVRHG